MSRLSKAAKKPLKSLLNIATLGQSGAISKALQNIRGKKGNAQVGAPSPVPAPVAPPISTMPVAPVDGKQAAYNRFWDEQLSKMGADNPYQKQYAKYKAEGMDPRMVMAITDEGSMSVPDYLKGFEGNLNQGKSQLNPAELTSMIQPPTTDPGYRLGVTPMPKDYVRPIYSDPMRKNITPQLTPGLPPRGPAAPWTDPREFIPVSNDPNYNGRALKLNPAYNPLLPQLDLKQAYLEKLKRASKELLPPRIPGQGDAVPLGGGLNLGPQERGFNQGRTFGGSLGNMKDSMGPGETPEAKRQKALNRFQTGNYGGK